MVAFAVFSLVVALHVTGILGEYIVHCPENSEGNQLEAGNESDETFSVGSGNFSRKVLRRRRWSLGHVAFARATETDDGAIRQEREQMWSNGFGHFNSPVLPTCDEPDDNVRGIYNSDLAPCEFSFHKSDQPPKSVGSTFGHLPTVCTDKNKLMLPKTKTEDSVTQYVFNWKDECVGDFARCYSLANHRHIYLSLLCRKKWEVPKGATHLSVNCTKDKRLKEERVAQRRKQQNQFDNSFAETEDKKMQASHKRWYDMKAFVSLLITVLVLVCIGFSFLAYRLVIRPYLAIKSHEVKREWKELLNGDDDEEEDEAVWQRGKRPLRRRAALGPSDP
jgi:hypothetical protein